MNIKFDDELLKNGFLNSHKYYLPFIGDGYEKSKLLIVGESHYLGQTRKN